MLTEQRIISHTPIDMPDSVESKILSHPDTVPEVEVKVEPPETPPPPCP